MSIHAIKRRVGETLVFELDGRITLGEASSSFRDMIRDAVAEGNKRIVIDVSYVSYIDSSGVGELVSAFTTVYNSGGNLVLCAPAIRVSDLLQITKLYTVYEVFFSLADAVAGVQSETVRYRCPVCGTWTIFGKGPEGDYRPCSYCGSRTSFLLSPGEQARSREIDRIEIPTYQGEHVTIHPGTPCRVQIAGRLDLFAMNAVRKANSRVSRAVFDLSLTTNATERAARSLLSHLSNISVIFSPNPGLLSTTDRSAGHLVFQDWDRAVEGHFNAIKRDAEQRMHEPIYGVSLSTSFSR
jgi:anti-sigma B factor antagonist